MAFAALAGVGPGCAQSSPTPVVTTPAGPGLARVPRVCVPEARAQSVYVADWPAPLRAELEAAMTHGSVMIRLTCEGIAIVRGCNGPGGYEEAPVGDPDSKLWSARDDDAGANLPLRGAALEREIPAGGSLVLGALEASRRSLAVPRSPAVMTVSDELGASCAGATHIVTTVHDGEVVLARRNARTADLPMSSIAPIPAGLELLVHASKAPFQLDLVPLTAHRPSVGVRAVTSLYPSAVSITTPGVTNGVSGAANGTTPVTSATAGAGATTSANGTAPGAPDSERGDADAGCKLGQAVSCTRAAMKASGGAARALLDRACRLGEVVACERLGLSLLEGDPAGSPSGLDAVRARSALDRACAARDAVACAKLGTELNDGRVLPRDFPLAVKSLSTACDEGDATSCLRGAERLAKWGNGDRDDARANVMFERACDKGAGIRQACYELGRRVASGQGGVPDIARAGELYLMGCSPTIPPVASSDGTSAASTYDPDNHACARAGAMYETGDGVKKDFDRGMELHLLACKQSGDKRSCLAAGNWLEKRSHGRGTALYQEVCRRFKLKEACQRATLP